MNGGSCVTRVPNLVINLKLLLAVVETTDPKRHELEEIRLSFRIALLFPGSIPLNHIKK